MNVSHIGVVPPRFKSRHAAAWFALLGALPSACVYDTSDRCGPHQVMYEDLRCVCDAESAPTETGCEVCGPDEMPGATGCVCRPGYSKADAAGVCEPVPLGLGAACDASTPCSDSKFECETIADGSGYCTSTGCASAAECAGGYACDVSVSPSVCRRPPLGLGTSCTSDADCAGTEATYCDTFQTHSCLVQGCRLTADDCFRGWECCDLSGFGVPHPVCVAQGGCSK